jgi:acetyl esterase/lipase
MRYKINWVCFIWVFCLQSFYAQRYLTNVYAQLDSIIGSTYGNSIDYLGNTQNLLYDLYSPKADTAQKRPLIIYIHGGGFTSGSRTYPSVKLLCQNMAKKGYAVANIDYRLDPSFQLYNSNSNRRAMTDAMHDAKQAIRYFKANANTFKLDTNKIYIGGESAGAITAMMASFIDKQAEMLPYPMANPNNPIGSSNNSMVSNSVKGTLCLCGMILDTTAIENSLNPPILWNHGSADSFIPISLAFNVVLRAAHVGLPIQTKLYNGATHCPWYYGNPNWQLYLDSVTTEITNLLYPKVVTSIKTKEIKNTGLKMFPNPCNEKLNIVLDKSYKNITVYLISTINQIQLKKHFENSNKLLIELGDILPGFYLLRLELDGSNYIEEKLIIENK